MASDLVLFETEIKPLTQYFEQALASVMPVERFMRTLVISAEKVPKILQCDRQSLMNAAMSAALLGVETDGVTGQSFILPFKNRAQLVVGYKGYNTIGARSGLTITGETVYEKDVFDYDMGSSPFVKHKKGTGDRGRVTYAWACAAALGRPPIITVLTIDEINAIKTKSPGGQRHDSPWNDPAIGFPAMASKSSKRRLARSMPLNVNAPQYHLAARLDEAFEEQGRPAYLDQKGTLQIENTYPEPQPSETPSAASLTTKTDATLDALKVAARGGLAALEQHWTERLTKADRTKYRDTELPALKDIARQADGVPSTPAPTNEAGYIEHFKSWLATIQTEADARARWQSAGEKELRDKCEVSGDQREALFKQLVTKFQGG